MRDKNNPICFFCMEYAINDDSHSYAGGLGILAGDYLLEAADEKLPVIAIGLHYGKDVSKDFSMMAIVDVPVANENIKVRVWQKNFGNSVTLLLLDTNVQENTEENRAITSALYDSRFYTRIKQELILGIGGVRVLKKYNITPRVYHLNEGHTAFAALAIKAEDPKNQSNVVATKHTIFSNAGSQIPRTDFEKFIKPYCERFGLNSQQIYDLGKFELDGDIFSTTKFLINSSRIANGVSVLHTIFEKKVHPHSKLVPITNGVYKKRWQSYEWGDSPQKKLTNREFWKVKNLLRAKLVSFVEEKTGIEMDSSACTVVWARRFAAYKRPFLLFTDLERLKKIVSNPSRPMQFIISGKAHPDDVMGKEAVQKIIDISAMPEFKGKVAYVPDYAMEVARFLEQGADIWLNTPERGKEACGTSGLKASLNGALQCSVSDGWVDEVDLKDKGWILSEDNTLQDLYNFLENDIPNLFFDRDADNLPNKLIEKMKNTVEMVDTNFTATRMIKDYVEKIY